MKIHYTLVCFLLLFVCSISGAAIAQESVIYGLLSDPDWETQRTDDQFIRLNFVTGEYTVVNTIPFNTSIYGNQPSTIDIRNQRITFHSILGRITSVDISTGEVTGKNSWSQRGIVGLHYNPMTHRYYALQYGDQLRFIAIDPDSYALEIVKEYEASKEPFAGRVTCMNVRAGLYYVITRGNYISSVNVLTGEVVNTVACQLNFGQAQFNAADGLIYGLHVDSGQNEDLISANPRTGEIQVLKENIINEKLNSYSSISGGIHHATNTYLVGRNYGLLAIDLNTLEVRKFSLPETLRFCCASLPNAVGDFQQLNGRVIADLNQNCEADANEYSVGRQTVVLQPLGMRMYSRADGTISSTIPYGEYSVETLPAWPWRVDCEPTPTRIIANDDGINVNKLTIPLTPESLFERLDVSIAGGAHIVGRLVRFHVEVFNSGTLPYSGTAQFTHDNRLELLTSHPELSAYTLNSGDFLIEDLAVGAGLTFVVDMRVPPDEDLLGKQFCTSVELKEGAVDILATHSSDEICEQVRGPYDPNDMAVSPVGFGESGEIDNEITTLTYTVRFQNTGDAPARDVVILNRLDADLDVNTIHFGAASHPYSVSLMAGDLLEFRFNGIELPGKQADEAGSQGVLKYSIDLNEDLARGTEIHNRASIYFDFNKPIITNTVLNTIGEAITDVVDIAAWGGSDELELRSLANGHFVLQRATSANALSGRLSVHSILGETVFEQALENVSKVAIDLSSLTSGRYFVRLMTAGETFVSSLVIQH